MKRLSLVFVVAALFFAACRENVKQAEKINKPLEADYFKRLEGVVGGNKLNILLQKQGDQLQGSYQIQGIAYHLTLDTLIGDSLVLITYKTSDPNWSNNNSERFHLKWTGNGFEGNWVSKDAQETLPVQLAEAYPVGSFELGMQKLVDSIKANSSVKNSPQATISLYFPTSKESWVDGQLKKAMDSTGIGSWPELVKGQFNEYQRFYKEEMEMLKNLEQVSSSFLNYYSGNRAVVKYNENGYLAIDQFREEYTGGAHGYYFSTFHNFDVVNKKKLGLTDIVKADSNLLRSLLEKEVRKDRGIQPNEKIADYFFVDKIYPSKEFYFNEIGLAFVYPPYEIASYADGQIEITIPYADIKRFLKPEFARRMKLN